jgi:hypothetical protein
MTIEEIYAKLVEPRAFQPGDKVFAFDKKFGPWNWSHIKNAIFLDWTRPVEMNNTAVNTMVEGYTIDCRILIQTEDGHFEISLYASQLLDHDSGLRWSPESRGDFPGLHAMMGRA